MKSAIFILSMLGIAIGCWIYGWVLLRVLSPNDGLQDNATITLSQIFFPGFMIAFGIRGMLGARRAFRSEGKSDRVR